MSLIIYFYPFANPHLLDYVADFPLVCHFSKPGWEGVPDESPLWFAQCGGRGLGGEATHPGALRDPLLHNLWHTGEALVV